MFAEIVLTTEDFTQALTKALPLTFHLGDEGKEELKLFDLQKVEIRAGKGLRAMCKAEVHWPVLGIEVPVVLNELIIVMTPSIGKTVEGDALLFGLRVEHADIEVLPDFMDNKITDIVNAALEKKDFDLAWNFSKTLAIAPHLPTKTLEPLDRFALKPAWGKVRIAEDTIVLATSFHFEITRVGERIPEALLARPGLPDEPVSARTDPPPPPSPPAPAMAPTPTSGGVASSTLGAAAGLFGFAVGVGLWSASRFGRR